MKLAMWITKVEVAIRRLLLKQDCELVKIIEVSDTMVLGYPGTKIISVGVSSSTAYCVFIPCKLQTGGFRKMVPFWVKVGNYAAVKS